MSDRGPEPGTDDWSEPAPPPPRFAVPAAAPDVPPQYVPGPAGLPPVDGLQVAPTASWSPPPPVLPRRNQALVMGIIALVALVVVPFLAIFTMWIIDFGSADFGSSPQPAVATSQSDESDTAGAGPVEATLQAMIDDYRDSRADGSLWGQIPKSEFNETAVTAFLYLLTDLKLAASFGADTSDYLDRAAELERRLLAEEPLGTDISITMTDRTFTYNGETGEGGFTSN